MRIRFVPGILALIALPILSTEVAFACQCSTGLNGKNAWENARQAEQRATVVFEGTPIKFEFRWSPLTAKEGELIPADIFSSGLDYLREPNMVITFRASRVYKGDVDSEVQLHTGLGGGDCAAGYAPGLNYLVYAGGSSQDELVVSMCSPGGWIERDEVATDLRYLRKERPTPTDLASIKRWSQPYSAEEETKRERDYEERHTKYDASTGRICVTLVHSDPKDNGGGSIAFLSTLGYSPFSPPYAERKEDGSFCSQNLGPGTYYLYFVQQDDHGASALYYPGVTDIAKATPVEVRAGNTAANIVFHIAKQPSYSVRGFISADDKLAFDSKLVDSAVALIRSDGDRRVWYSATTKYRVLSKLLYFKFDNVVPGRYFAFVQGGAGWMSRKIEVDVTTHSKFISVDLVRKK